MNPSEYFDSVEDRLFSDSFIVDLDFVDRWQTDVNGYIRVKLTFANGQRLQFSEYIQRTSNEQIGIVTYAYQWMTAEHNLLCRWDNTPHFRQLPGFPCHRHENSEGNVFADEPQTIFTILKEIEKGKT